MKFTEFLYIAVDNKTDKVSEPRETPEHAKNSFWSMHCYEPNTLLRYQLVGVAESNTKGE